MAIIETSELTKIYKGYEIDPRGTWISVHGLGLWIKNIVNSFRLVANLTPPVLAVDKVSLAINEGEIFGLLGPNGAGKTTLIKMLSALIKPTSGTAVVDGYDLIKDRREIRRSISYVSTTGWMGLEWPFTVEESLIFYSRALGIPRRNALHRIKEVLEITSLAEDRDKIISQLSHGMRQRLVLARGLLVRTPVIFLDEPTVGLDPATARDIRTLVKSKLVGEYGQTVILTTHNIQEVEEICDRVGVINKGRMIALGTAGELRRHIRDRQVTDMRVGNLTYGIIEELKGQPWVLGVSANIQDPASGIATLRLHSRKGAGDIGGMLSFLRSRNVAVSFVGQAEPNLEDVFLHLTGAGLR